MPSSESSGAIPTGGIGQIIPADAQIPGRHKPRVSLACDTCKTRKTRCDGRQPICHACETRGLSASCTWNFPRRRQLKRKAEGSPSATSVSSMSNPSTAPPPPTSANTGRDLPPPVRSNHALPATVPPPSSAVHNAYATPRTPSVASHAHTVKAPSSPQDQSDSSKVDGLATLAGGNDGSVYGGSSTIAFMRNVFPGQSRRASLTPSNLERERQPTPLSIKIRQGVIDKPERLSELNDGAAILPRRRSADSFVACFWEFIHPLFPVLHRPSFMKHYERLWASDQYTSDHDPEPLYGLEEVIFTSTLNLVFALGSNFSSLVEPAQKNSVADDFYQRSRNLLLFEILDSTSLALVQMLLLTGVYLQSTQYANRCWNFVGLAIRVAQSLGLHLNDNGKKPPPQLEREMRRRVWFTCVNLDRLLAMTFGRPTMLSHSWTVPIPKLIDDEYLSNTIENEQPAGIPSNLGLFVSSCRLFELLEEILRSFYSGDPTPDLSKHETASSMAKSLIEPVLQYNRRLDDFLNNVPPYLRISDNADILAFNNNSLELQKQVLYCRFLYVRLLSLRRLLMVATKGDRRMSSHIISGAQQASLDDEVIRRCCALCAETASRLIETLHKGLDTLYRSSGWHSVYFTFSAAMVLLAACKCPDVSITVKDPGFEADWARCLVILHHFEDQINSATRAIEVLETIKQQVTALDTQKQYTRQASAMTQYPYATSVPPPVMPGVQPTMMEGYPPVSLDFTHPFGADNMSEAWFGQQLLNLDWLEAPAMPQYNTQSMPT